MKSLNSIQISILKFLVKQERWNKKYKNVTEKWKIGFIKEILMIKYNNLLCFIIITFIYYYKYISLTK